MWPAAALDCALKQSHEEPARHVDDEDAQRKRAPDHVHDGDIAAEAAQRPRRAADQHGRGVDSGSRRPGDGGRCLRHDDVPALVVG